MTSKDTEGLSILKASDLPNVKDHYALMTPQGLNYKHGKIFLKNRKSGQRSKKIITADLSNLPQTMVDESTQMLNR